MRCVLLRRSDTLVSRMKRYNLSRAATELQNGKALLQRFLLIGVWLAAITAVVLGLLYATLSLRMLVSPDSPGRPAAQSRQDLDGAHT